MVIHYHGADINPIPALYEMAGRHFCVSFLYPSHVARVHSIGQSVMLDNGAFTAWRKGTKIDWNKYYVWADKWLDCPTTWAVIPDVVEGGANEQDELIKQWPHSHKGAPCLLYTSDAADE